MDTGSCHNMPHSAMMTTRLRRSVHRQRRPMDATTSRQRSSGQRSSGQRSSGARTMLQSRAVAASAPTLAALVQCGPGRHPRLSAIPRHGGFSAPGWNANGNRPTENNVDTICRQVQAGSSRFRTVNRAVDADGGSMHLRVSEDGLYRHSGGRHAGAHAALRECHEGGLSPSRAVGPASRPATQKDPRRLGEGRDAR